MDIKDLFLSCKRGDIDRVKYLVEERDVDLSVKDRWDSSPLYYACLCGHMDIVKYLLDAGARCEAQTFDGERCVYGALNDEIRALLKNYKAVTSNIMRRDLFNEFMRRMFEVGGYEDISFTMSGEEFTAHRCVLATRCHYIADLLESKWEGKSEIPLKTSLISSRAFHALLCYMYTARIKIHMDLVDDVIRLAKYCHMESLLKQIEDRKEKIKSLEKTKSGVNVTVFCLEPQLDSTELHDDLSVLADLALPSEFSSTTAELPFPPQNIQTYPDVIFSVENHHFRCHKVFFSGRSDYFKALIEDHFGESSTDDFSNLQIITLNEISPLTFIEIMYYIYQDKCQINESNVFDILVAADMFLLPGLKRQCSATLIKMADPDNIVAILRTSRLFNLAKLEDECAEFIANNLDKLLLGEDFITLVHEDARSVENREETDSIPIIDDVRFHITSYVQTFSDMYEADQRMADIDRFLEDIGLEG